MVLPEEERNLILTKNWFQFSLRWRAGLVELRWRIRISWDTGWASVQHLDKHLLSFPWELKFVSFLWNLLSTSFMLIVDKIHLLSFLLMILRNSHYEKVKPCLYHLMWPFTLVHLCVESTQNKITVELNWFAYWMATSLPALKLRLSVECRAASASKN